jgi:hypothetical protein
MSLKISTLSRLLLCLLAVFTFLSQPAMAEAKKVAFFPLTFNGDASKSYLRQGLRTMFISRLSDQEIEIVGDETIRSLLEREDNKEIVSPGRAGELARRIGADYALFGSITALGQTYSIDLGIRDLKQTDPKWISAAASEDQLFSKVEELAKASKAMIIGTVTVAVKEPQKPAITVSPEKMESQGGTLFKPQEVSKIMAPAGSLTIKTGVMAFDIGDLDGDGVPELVVLSRKEVMVYVKQGDRFALKDTLKSTFGSEFLKISLGDADGNGKDELFIVSLSGMRVESSIWQWTSKFEKRQQLKGHLRITKTDGHKPVILLQESLPQADSFFSGEIWVMAWDGKGMPAKQKPLMLPKGAQFYTIAFADLTGDGKEETLFLGPVNARERGSLMVCTAAGEMLWQSGDETFGATNNFVVTDDNRSRSGERRIPLNPSPVVMDADGNGRNEVVVVKNLAFADFIKLKSYSTSSLTVYKAEGRGLEPLFNSGENKYSVVDMHAEKGVLFIATHEPPLTTFSDETGKIMWFK